MNVSATLLPVPSNNILSCVSVCVLPDLMQAASAKATRKQEKVLLPKSLFVPDDQVCGWVW